LTQALLEQLDFPLAAPSANPFGYVSPTTAFHVQKQLSEKVSYILDGGECDVGIESTIIGFENGIPVVFRLGGLQLEQIEAITGPVVVKTKEGASPVAAGMIENHYAPRKSIQLGEIESAVTVARKNGSLATLGLLSFNRDWSGCGAGLALCLSASGSLEEAAHKLFAAMRQLDESAITHIVAESVPDVGLGRAINDRLQRATAAKR
jgi:L-threonylcarbamoyladenylate synthase